MTKLATKAQDSSMMKLLSYHARDFESTIALCNNMADHVRNSNIESTEFIDMMEITYEGINTQTFQHVLKELGEDLRIHKPRISFNSISQVLRIRHNPNPILGCHYIWIMQACLEWFRSGVLTVWERRNLLVGPSYLYKFTQGPYAGSALEPGSHMKLLGASKPTVVIHSGWSESRPGLMVDMNMCLRAGDGDFNAVIIMTWNVVASSNRLEGTVELFTRDNQGLPVRQQVEPIFPASFPVIGRETSQALRFTRGMIFGPEISSDRNPSDPIDLDLDLLRGYTVQDMRVLGLVPA